MPNPFFSALLPSLSQSATGGATGALEGQMAGEDRLLANQLKQAQIEWQRAHAAGYGHQQRLQQTALDEIRQGLAKDPNFLSTMPGRLWSMKIGHFDPYAQDALAYQRQQQGNAAGAHGELYDSQRDTDVALRQPKIEALGALAEQRLGAGGLSTARADDIRATQPSRIGLNTARTATEGARQGLYKNQAALAAARTALQKQLGATGAGGKAPNLYSMADTYMKKIQAARAQGVEPDENDVAMLEVLMEKIAGPEFVPMPLGSETMGSRLTGQKAQPAVPEKPGGLLSKPSPAVPGTQPSRKPLTLTPKARPGKVEHEQAILKARKLITERGAKFAEEQLKSNKALTPTEKLALQEALLLEAGQR